MTRRTVRHGERTRGQGLVEFSLALMPFILLFMGVTDLGRGIYMSSGASQAAREIARTTAVHPCNTASCSLGNSAETLATIATQRGLVPGLTPSGITIACATITDTTVASTAANPCDSGKYIRVTVSVPYYPVTPFVSMIAPSTLVATAHVEVP